MLWNNLYILQATGFPLAWLLCLWYKTCSVGCTTWSQLKWEASPGQTVGCWSRGTACGAAPSLPMSHHWPHPSGSQQGIQPCQQGAEPSATVCFPPYWFPAINSSSCTSRHLEEGIQWTVFEAPTHILPMHRASAGAKAGFAFYFLLFSFQNPTAAVINSSSRYCCGGGLVKSQQI